MSLLSATVIILQCMFIIDLTSIIIQVQPLPILLLPNSSDPLEENIQDVTDPAEVDYNTDLLNEMKFPGENISDTLAFYTTTDSLGGNKLDGQLNKTFESDVSLTRNIFDLENASAESTESPDHRVMYLVDRLSGILGESSSTNVSANYLTELFELPNRTADEVISHDAGLSSAPTSPLTPLYTDRVDLVVDDFQFSKENYDNRSQDSVDSIDEVADVDGFEDDVNVSEENQNGTTSWQFTDFLNRLNISKLNNIEGRNKSAGVDDRKSAEKDGVTAVDVGDSNEGNVFPEDSATDMAQQEDEDYLSKVPVALENLPLDVPPHTSITEVLAENAIKDKQYDELRLEELVHELMTHSMGFGEFYPGDVEYDDGSVITTNERSRRRKSGRGFRRQSAAD